MQNPGTATGHSSNPHPMPITGKPPPKPTNPCCCTGCCNTRCNCIFIATCLLIACVCLNAVGFEKMPVELDCEHYLSPPIPMQEFILHCEDMNRVRLGLTAMVVIVTVFWFLAAMLIFISAFARVAVPAQIAGFFIFIALLVYMVMIGVAVGKYIKLEDTGVYNQNLIFDRDGVEFTYAETIAYATLASIGGLLSIICQIWSAYCCFQFKKHIEVGTDLDPIVKKGAPQGPPPLQRPPPPPRPPPQQGPPPTVHTVQGPQPYSQNNPPPY